MIKHLTTFQDVLIMNISPTSWKYFQNDNNIISKLFYISTETRLQ